MFSIAEWADRASALSYPKKLTNSASFSPNIRISLRLKIHQAQAKNFCRVLDIRVAVLMKHVTTYQKTKPVYEAYRRAKDKDAYRAKQESSLILHEAAVKTLKAAGVTKLPNLAAMQEEYGKLQAQKEALYADYGKLKKQVKEYDVIKQNIDNILRQGKEPERKKGKERE